MNAWRRWNRRLEKKMINEEAFRVLVVNLTEGKSEPALFGSPSELLGGSGLAAGLFALYGIMDAPADHPDQPLIFAIGPLTAYFPLMSKVVLGFKSPYNGQYAESHAGGRLGLALRFAGYDALVIKGVARTPSCLIVGSRNIGIRDVHYLWGLDVLNTGKHLRRFSGKDSGHRSILRIGPAGERGVAFASINVDTYRHFGRLGGGAVMGAKRLKGIIVLGDGSLPLPGGKAYRDLYKTVYQEVTQTPAMKKYHDLGTLENMLPLNELHAVPWRNLQATHDENVQGITGQRFAEELLLRKTACSGCPVGCIHVGLLREKFAEQNEFQYRQVSYDHEPVFAAGSMLGVTNAGGVLTLLEEMERQGLDVMSAGVALEERRRVQLTCMVSCLFARNIYSEERLQECLSSLGLSRLAQSVVARSKDVQAKRWQLKYMTGYNPKDISIPKRFEEVTTWKGAIDKVFMDSVAADYQNAVRKLAESGQSVQSS